MNKDELKKIIADIKDEVELITDYSNDIVSQSGQWYLKMQTDYLKKVINDLERLL